MPNELVIEASDIEIDEKEFEENDLELTGNQDGNNEELIAKL